MLLSWGQFKCKLQPSPIAPVFLHLKLFWRQALNHILCTDFLPSASHVCVCNPDLNNGLLLSCDSFLRLLCLSGDPMCHSCMKFLSAIIILVRICVYSASKINLQARESIQESLSKQGDKVSEEGGRNDDCG